jgi:hypothetical protein
MSTKPLLNYQLNVDFRIFQEGFNFGHTTLRAECSPADKRILPEAVPLS